MTSDDSNSGVRQHIRSNVVGYVGVFLALTGSAVALPGKGSVRGDDIAAEAVRSKHIRDGHVRAADIGTGQVGASAIADGAIESPEIAAGTVAGQHVADASLNGDDIEANSLGTDHVDEESLRFECRFSVVIGEVGDVCYSPLAGPSTLAEAEQTCLGFRGRLPSVGEGRLIHVDLGSVMNNRTTWTGDYTSQLGAMVLSQGASSGAITASERAETTENFFFCVRSPIAAAPLGST